MTLSELADLAEIIGGIAVVVSLVYLAIQVRQNTHSIRSATLQANTGLWSTLLTTLATPGTVEAYAAGMSGMKEIPRLTYTQFFLMCRGLFAAFENQYFQYRQGILDDPTYLGYERAIAEQCLAFPGFRLWWKQSSHVFSEAFVEHVDNMISRTPLAGPDKFFQEWQAMERDELPVE